MLKIIKYFFVIFPTCLNLIGATPTDLIKFHYLGHSSFLIFFSDEISVLTDYGKPNAYLEYGWDSPVYDIGDFQPTIVTYSHTHDDHYDSTRIPKNTKYILKEADTLKIRNLTIYPILTSENNLSVKSNISYLFEYKGIRVLHLGDCQANILYIDSTDNINYIRENIPLHCDVVLLPIEGRQKYIPQAAKFIRIIEPKTVIPMHYWSDKYKDQFCNYISKTKINDMKECKVIKNTSVYIYSRSVIEDNITVISISPTDYK